MTASADITVGQVAERVRMLDVKCSRCDRAGRLSLSRLLLELGADALCALSLCEGKSSCRGGVGHPFPMAEFVGMRPLEDGPGLRGRFGVTGCPFIGGHSILLVRAHGLKDRAVAYDAGQRDFARCQDLLRIALPIGPGPDFGGKLRQLLDMTVVIGL